MKLCSACLLGLNCKYDRSNNLEKAAREVYKLVSKFDYGIKIYTNNKTKNEVVKEILSYLPKN